MNRASSTRKQRSEPPASRYRVQVLDRTIAVLQAVADSDTDLPAADIARQLRLHKSTVHRLLVVLESYRLIKKGPEGAYGLGTRLIELGECAIARLKLSEYAEPHLRTLADQTGEGAHVTILNGTELLSIAHVEGRWALHSLTRTGQRTQIHSTAAGKAVLAFLSGRGVQRSHRAADAEAEYAAHDREALGDEAGADARARPRLRGRR